MILKNYLTIFFLCTNILLCMSQENVCENSGSEFVDLNTIGKCSIENFKKSNNKEYVKIATRKRYVRKRNNSHLINLKKKIKEIAATNTKTSTIKKVDKNAVEIASKEVAIKDYIRFDQVSEIPVFITCAGTDEDEKEGCVKETFIHNVIDNLIYPFDAAAEGIEGVVWVRFIVDTDGYIKNISTKGPDNGILLEKEAERLITLLPKFIPGKSNNNYVNVEYFMPIDFQLDE